MEKIDIYEFAKICKQKLNFLCIEYNYSLSEKTEKSLKKENTIFYKLIYTNFNYKRQIEFVLLAEDYQTHMFCTIMEVYIKRLLFDNETYKIPDYYDAENCLEDENIEKLLPQKNQKQLSLMYGKYGWDIYDCLDTRKYIIENSVNIVKGDYFPTIDELTKAYSAYFGREWKYDGRSKDFFLIKLKETIKSVENYGYEIIFDETKLQPYDRDNMNPQISYFNKKYNLLIEINFEGRDFKFFAHKNKSRDYWLYGTANGEEYKKLEQKMTNEVLKTHINLNNLRYLRAKKIKI